jgi:hypothetical protein
MKIINSIHHHHLHHHRGRLLIAPQQQQPSTHLDSAIEDTPLIITTLLIVITLQLAVPLVATQADHQLSIIKCLHHLLMPEAMLILLIAIVVPHFQATIRSIVATVATQQCMQHHPLSTIDPQILII